MVLAVLVAILAYQAVRPGRPAARPPAPGGRPSAEAPQAAGLLFGGRLDLNAATATDLEALPGVGPARAAAIVRMRRARGRFDRLEELLDVPGLGDKTLERLRPFVLIRPE